LDSSLAFFGGILRTAGTGRRYPGPQSGTPPGIPHSGPENSTCGPICSSGGDQHLARPVCARKPSVIPKEIGILHVDTGVHRQPVQTGFEQLVGLHRAMVTQASSLVRGRLSMARFRRKLSRTTSVCRIWRILGRVLETCLAPRGYDYGTMAPLWSTLSPTLFGNGDCERPVTPGGAPSSTSPQPLFACL
jgi:hypothetical protein